MSDTAIKIENLKKQYTLGAIGGRTLNAELQSWWARKRGKADPNLKLGENYADFGESFYALNGINLEIKKGEAVGIIGGNGAGKSTLLKILSRVTAPTEGDVWINGRIASMLEVGTGFHGELTGRENIYMNGAILGMTKKEVDQKMESIIDFSECRQFIDTPVKRYSSGMYVKLAFAVASHLDAEIMIMDEVLAVGDMAFQKKCLGKMGDEAHGGKTVLYVSHNMATIRNLCSRCIVLQKGRMIFDGEPEKAIDIYLNNAETDLKTMYDLTKFKRVQHALGSSGRFNYIKILNKKIARFKDNESISFEFSWSAKKRLNNVLINLTLKYADGSAVGYTDCRTMLKDYEIGEYKTILNYDVSNLAEGVYIAYFHLSEINISNELRDIDQSDQIYFEIINDSIDKTNWKRQYWGSIRLPKLVEVQNENIIL
ncbi:ABC transporter ATP-binding protein [Selenomonas ruminantium]|uniref:Lipopolysaccharide transport system ATP-binding protein n=1 Tax=Selenomonas ruminantium TaxID=971 RepID=A0A1I0XWF7_SELRU|nr:ABC transporter ATP-binding protein [Selenomonas ruminantium]SFB05244.1 lipopolysaccharide transport system ATP-binding protein [Selenomonas ruminantium]